MRIHMIVAIEVSSWSRVLHAEVDIVNQCMLGQYHNDMSVTDEHHVTFVTRNIVYNTQCMSL